MVGTLATFKYTPNTHTADRSGHSIVAGDGEMKVKVSGKNLIKRSSCVNNKRHLIQNPLTVPNCTSNRHLSPFLERSLSFRVLDIFTRSLSWHGWVGLVLILLATTVHIGQFLEPRTPVVEIVVVLGAVRCTGVEWWQGSRIGTLPFVVEHQ